MIVFKTTLKRILKQPINWVFILLFPVIFNFLLSSSNSGDVSVINDVIDGISFGVVDQDGTTLSQALVKGLELRYNVQKLMEEDVAAVLTDAEVPWVLLIREGYGRDVLAGTAPALDGYSLTVSDVSALGSVSAQNLTRALLLLGTDDPDSLDAWVRSSHVDVAVLRGDSWNATETWLRFYGFVSIFTAYFIIKTLTDDKRGGMPDRLGVVPRTQRVLLIQSTLAAFVLTEITALLMILVLRYQMGPFSNAVFLFLLLSLYNLFSVGLVLTIVSMLRDMGASSVVMSMLATVFAMLGGLFWPLEIVPEFMHKVAWFSPGYWFAQGLGSIPNVTFEGFGLSLLFLAGFTAVVFLIGGWTKTQRAD